MEQNDRTKRKRVIEIERINIEPSKNQSVERFKNRLNAKQPFFYPKELSITWPALISSKQDLSNMGSLVAFQCFVFALNPSIIRQLDES